MRCHCDIRVDVKYSVVSFAVDADGHVLSSRLVVGTTRSASLSEYLPRHVALVSVECDPLAQLARCLRVVSLDAVGDTYHVLDVGLRCHY